MSFPTITITRDTLLSDQQVGISVEVIEQFTEHSPARLRIRFTNEGSTAREFLFGSVPPFGPLVCSSDSSGAIHVIPDDDTVVPTGHYADVIPHRPVDECWQLTGEYTIVDRGILWPADPGATTTTAYAVLNDPEASDCLPPGEYRFENEWGERYADEEDEWYSWGFALVLEY